MYSIKILKTIITIIILLTMFNSCNFYKGPVSDHFDGTSFFNEEKNDSSFSDHLKWLWNMETLEWPEWVIDQPQPAPTASVLGKDMRVTYINHATVLIQMNGINILTDPVWSHRAGPFPWIGAKRVRAPGIKIKDLPKIHMILISHDHYDHLDFQTLKELSEIHKPVIVTGIGVDKRLKSSGFEKVYGMDWWDEYSFYNDIRITFTPSRHNSGRGLFDKNKTLWGSFVIEGTAGRVLFIGDSAFGTFVDKIKKRFDNFRLALLPIGSYEKRWFMKYQHMNPEEAVKIHNILNVKQSIGIHFGTFNEHPEQSITAHEEDLKNALIKHGVNDSRFLVPEFGEGINVPD